MCAVVSDLGFVLKIVSFWEIFRDLCWLTDIFLRHRMKKWLLNHTLSRSVTKPKTLNRIGVGRYVNPCFHIS